MTDEAIIITGEERIRVASLLALRGALKLEMRGLMRRGDSANTIACRRLGLRRGTPRAVTLRALTDHINALMHRGTEA
jgi:hypothetical protein